MNPGEAGEGTDRRTRVLDVAAATFLCGGYTATTMDVVARGAGISKKTLYRMYPSKLALLEALLHDRMVDASPPEPSTSTDPEQRLFEYMSNLISVVLSPQQIALMRMIVSESSDGAVLSAAYRRIAVEQKVRQAQRFLAAEQARNNWAIPDADMEQATDFLFSLTAAKLLIDRLLQFDHGVVDPAHHIRRGVRFFLRAVDAPLPTQSDRP